VTASIRWRVPRSEASRAGGEMSCVSRASHTSCQLLLHFLAAASVGTLSDGVVQPSFLLRRWAAQSRLAGHTRASVNSAKPSMITIRILRAASNLLPRSSPPRENKHLSFFRNLCFSVPIPRRGEGVSRSSRNVVRNAVDAEVPVDERARRRTAKLRGPVAPTLATRWRRC
jgi:hypothetical protein